MFLVIKVHGSNKFIFAIKTACKIMHFYCIVFCSKYTSVTWWCNLAHAPKTVQPKRLEGTLYGQQHSFLSCPQVSRKMTCLALLQNNCMRHICISITETIILAYQQNLNKQKIMSAIMKLSSLCVRLLFYVTVLLGETTNYEDMNKVI